MKLPACPSFEPTKCFRLNPCWTPPDAADTSASSSSGPEPKRARQVLFRTRLIQPTYGRIISPNILTIYPFGSCCSDRRSCSVKSYAPPPTQASLAREAAVKYHLGQYGTLRAAGLAHGVNENNMALVGDAVRAYRQAIGHAEGSAAAAAEEEEDDDDDDDDDDDGHAKYLAAWIWCRDEYKKRERGAAKIRLEALDKKEFSRCVPSVPTILDASRNNLDMPRNMSNPTRAPHMPEEVTDKVAETVAMMRMKKLPVFPSIVINIAKAFIVDTDYELLFREAAPGAGGGAARAVEGEEAARLVLQPAAQALEGLGDGESASARYDAGKVDDGEEPFRDLRNLAGSSREVRHRNPQRCLRHQ